MRGLVGGPWGFWLLLSRGPGNREGGGSWESGLNNLYTIKGQYDTLVETSPEVLPGRRDGMGREDSWAWDRSLRGFHALGRGSLSPQSCLQKRWRYSTEMLKEPCLLAGHPSLCVHSLVQEECELDSHPELCYSLSQAKGQDVPFWKSFPWMRALKLREAK